MKWEYESRLVFPDTAWEGKDCEDDEEDQNIEDEDDKDEGDKDDDCEHEKRWGQLCWCGCC